MKKRILFFLLALSVLLSGCGAGAGADTAASNGVARDTTAESAAAADVVMDAGFASGSTAAPDVPLEADSDSTVARPKIIYTADVSAEASDFDTATSQLDALVAQVDGYYEHASTSGSTGYRYANYTIRLPREQFENFLGSLDGVCHLTYVSKDKQDVSETYYDLDARLATQTTKRDRLLELLEKAETMEDIIALESALSDVQYQIESLSGSLRQYDSLIDYSTITLSLQEVRSLTDIAADNSLTAQLKQAFRGGGQAFLTFLEGLLILIVSLWPFLLVLVIVLPIAVHFLRRRAARRDAEDPGRTLRHRIHIGSAKETSKPHDDSDKQPPES